MLSVLADLLRIPQTRCCIPTEQPWTSFWNYISPCPWIWHYNLYRGSKYILLHSEIHGRLARWRKWRACDVGEAKGGLEIELWRRWSNGRVGEWAVNVGKATDGLKNELWRRWSDGKVGEWALLILQAFRRFTYVTTHSPALPSLYLRSQLILQPFRCFT